MRQLTRAMTERDEQESHRLAGRAVNVYTHVVEDGW
jgi:hypothetical protein